MTMDTLLLLPTVRWLSIGLGLGLALGYGLAWLTALFSGAGPDRP